MRAYKITSFVFLAFAAFFAIQAYSTYRTLQYIDETLSSVGGVGLIPSGIFVENVTNVTAPVMEIDGTKAVFIAKFLRKVLDELLWGNIVSTIVNALAFVLTFIASRRS